MSRTTLARAILVTCLGATLWPLGLSIRSRSPAAKAAVRVVNPDVKLPAVLWREVQGQAAPFAATYRLENSAATPQAVELVGVGCGPCTSVWTGGREVRPGDQLILPPRGGTEVVLRSRPGGAFGDKTFLARFAVVGDGDDRIDLPVSYRVTVLPDVKVVPDVISHQFTKADRRPVEKIVTVERFVRGPLPPPCVPNLIAAPPSVKLVRARPSEPPAQVEPGLWKQTWELLFTITPAADFPSANSPQVLRLELQDREGTAVAQSRLTAVVRQAVGVTAPGQLHFGTAQLGERRLKRFLLCADDGRIFRVTRLSSDSPAFAASALTPEARQVQCIDVTFHPTRTGQLSSQLVVETDHPDRPRLVIDLGGAVVPDDSAG